MSTSLRFAELTLARDGLGISACGIETSGYPYCWGEYFAIDVGRPYGSAPTLIDDAVEVTTLSNGGRHACAIAIDQSAICWGSYIAGIRGGAGGH